jgi:hypothetical protein
MSGLCATIEAVLRPSNGRQVVAGYVTGVPVTRDLRVTRLACDGEAGSAASPRLLASPTR